MAVGVKLWSGESSHSWSTCVFEPRALLPGLFSMVFFVLLGLSVQSVGFCAGSWLHVLYDCCLLAWWVQDIRVHPRQLDWILAKVRRDECMLDRHSSLCAYDLFLSKVGAFSY